MVGRTRRTMPLPCRHPSMVNTWIKSYCGGIHGLGVALDPGEAASKKQVFDAGPRRSYGI
jgi:hypothetical protein